MQRAEQVLNRLDHVSEDLAYRQPVSSDFVRLTIATARDLSGTDQSLYAHLIAVCLGRICWLCPSVRTDRATRAVAIPIRVARRPSSLSRAAIALTI